MLWGSHLGQPLVVHARVDVRVLVPRILFVRSLPDGQADEGVTDAPKAAWPSQSPITLQRPCISTPRTAIPPASDLECAAPCALPESLEAPQAFLLPPEGSRLRDFRTTDRPFRKRPNDVCVCDLCLGRVSSVLWISPAGDTTGDPRPGAEQMTYTYAKHYLRCLACLSSACLESAVTSGPFSLRVSTPSLCRLPSTPTPSLPSQLADPRRSQLGSPASAPAGTAGPARGLSCETLPKNRNNGRTQQK